MTPHRLAATVDVSGKTRRFLRNRYLGGGVRVRVRDHLRLANRHIAEIEAEREVHLHFAGIDPELSANGCGIALVQLQLVASQESPGYGVADLERCFDDRLVARPVWI